MNGVKVDNLIRQAGDNGWDFFEQLFQGPGERPSSISPEDLAKNQRLAAVWSKFYASADGKIAIDHLCDITIGRASFVSHLGLPMEAAYGHGCHREGQNAIVFLVLKMIAQGQQRKKPRERTEP